MNLMVLKDCTVQVHSVHVYDQEVPATQFKNVLENVKEEGNL